MNTTDAKILKTSVQLWKKPHYLGRMSFKEWMSVYFHYCLPVAYMTLVTALFGYLIGGFGGTCMGYMASLLSSFIYGTCYIRHSQLDRRPTIFNSRYILEIAKEYLWIDLYSGGEIFI